MKPPSSQSNNCPLNLAATLRRSEFDTAIDTLAITCSMGQKNRRVAMQLISDSGLGFDTCWSLRVQLRVLVSYVSSSLLASQKNETGDKVWRGISATWPSFAQRCGSTQRNFYKAWAQSGNNWNKKGESFFLFAFAYSPRFGYKFPFSFCRLGPDVTDVAHGGVEFLCRPAPPSWKLASRSHVWNIQSYF